MRKLATGQRAKVEHAKMTDVVTDARHRDVSSVPNTAPGGRVREGCVLILEGGTVVRGCVARLPHRSALPSITILTATLVCAYLHAAVWRLMHASRVTRPTASENFQVQTAVSPGGACFLF